MAKINTYITYDGNCLEAFEFYKSVFGGEFKTVAKYKDMPPTEDMQIPEEEKERIMHMCLPISAETILMGTDKTSACPPLTVGNNFTLVIDIDTIEEADRVFAGLSQGGKVLMPMQKTFWAKYFGMFTDKFNINWMINVE